jgi:hypothetical protein
MGDLWYNEIAFPSSKLVIGIIFPCIGWAALIKGRREEYKY